MLAATALAFVATASCAGLAPEPPVDLLLINGRVYTLSWPDPSVDGQPAAGAPFSQERGWHPDAEAIAIRDGRIVFAGAGRDAEPYRPQAREIIDLGGSTVVPGLIESHAHVLELGATLERVNLVGVQTEAEAIDRVAARAGNVPKDAWIVGWGWDEGAWANRYPDMKALSARVPDHPVLLRGLHGFAIWGNRLAFERAGITRSTNAPVGGEIRTDERGNPTGILINRAGALLEGAVPKPTAQQVEARMIAGLQTLAAAGYVSVHEAGADAAAMAAIEALERERRLPIRVYVMLSASDQILSRAWLTRGPYRSPDGMLTVRAVKAFYDGALGSRGARLLADYADRPGHRGLSGDDYRFDQTLVASLMKAGFQACIHAIGDAGNRETLDFIQSVEAAQPAVKKGRQRIEHAQVVDPDDVPRFAALEVIASMEPPHAVEDKEWAEARLGPARVRGGYAWRTLRKAGARLAFNSDLPGSDYDVFYGLHAAITRRDKRQQPPDGWYPEQRMSPEEALRGYTSWGAYSAFQEGDTGIIAPGRWADLTVMDVDPLVAGSTAPGTLLDGSIRMTIVNGRVVHRVDR